MQEMLLLCRFLIKADRGAGGNHTEGNKEAIVLFRSIAGEQPCGKHMCGLWIAGTDSYHALQCAQASPVLAEL